MQQTHATGLRQQRQKLQITLGRVALSQFESGARPKDCCESRQRRRHPTLHRFDTDAEWQRIPQPHAALKLHRHAISLIVALGGFGRDQQMSRTLKASFPWRFAEPPPRVSGYAEESVCNEVSRG